MPDRAIFSDGWPWCRSITWFWVSSHVRLTIYQGVMVCRWYFPRAELVHRDPTVVINHARFALPGGGRRTLELIGENDERAHIIFPVVHGIRDIRIALAEAGFVVQESRSRWIPRGLGPEWSWLYRFRRPRLR
jgi:hypothetical protein